MTQSSHAHTENQRRQTIVQKQANQASEESEQEMSADEQKAAKRKEMISEQRKCLTNTN